MTVWNTKKISLGSMRKIKNPSFLSLMITCNCTPISFYIRILQSGLFSAMDIHPTQKKMAYQAEHFFNMGYNILIPDARGHGQSEGKYIGMGWHERLDIVRWAQWITTQYQNTKITLYGISMGAATVMMTAGEKLPYNVKCIIEDCGYASVRGEFQHVLNHYMKIPSFPILQISAIHTKLRAGYNYLKEGNATEQLKKCHIPILFIHGQQDTFVPFSMMQTVYEAAAGEKQALIIPDAGHAECCMKNPDLYWKTIYHFLNHYIPEESATQKQAHA